MKLTSTTNSKLDESLKIVSKGMAQIPLIRKAEYQHGIHTSDNMVRNMKILSVKNILLH